MAESLKLGYFNSALIFGAGIAIVSFCFYVFKVNAVLSWCCRPHLARVWLRPARRQGFA